MNKGSTQKLAKMLFWAAIFSANQLLATTFTFTSSGDWASPAQWAGGAMPPSSLAPGDKIVINPGAIATLNTGSQTIENGATFDILGNFIIDGASVFNNSGITTVDGLLDIMSISGHIYNYDSGILTINSYFRLHFGHLYNSGTVDFLAGMVLNTDVDFINSGNATIAGDNNYLDGGSIDNSGYFTLADGFDLPLGNNGNFTNTGAGILEISGTVTIYDGILRNGPNGKINNNYHLIVDGGQVENEGIIECTPASAVKVNIGLLHNRITGTINTSAGTFHVNDAQLTNEGKIHIFDDGNIQLTTGTSQFENTGTLIIDGEFNQLYGEAIQAGYMKGHGFVVGNCFPTATATIAPGNSPGCLTFQDVLKNAGIFEIEIGGPTPCTEFDQLIDPDNMFIGDATLKVDFINGFVPTDGQEFDVILSPDYNSTFATLILNAPPNVDLTVDYRSDRVTILAAVLPIELVSFKAVPTEKTVELDWKTASETNNRGFYIEKSIDGKTWAEIGFVAGAGDSRRELGYQFSDESPVHGPNFYRLRQTDFDGKTEFSPVATVVFSKNSRVETAIAPSLVTDGRADLIVGTTDEGMLDLQVVAADGRTVFVEKMELSGANLRFPLDLSGLPQGVYAASLRMDGQVLPTVRFVVK